MNKKIHEYLNTQVSNFAVFFAKLRRYHWLVKGEHFFTLHQEFENLYNKVNDFGDEIAERLITIGGTPDTELKKFITNSKLKENVLTDYKDMVKDLISDLKILSKTLQQGIVLINNLNTQDEVTIDLLVEIIKELDKNTWMFSSFLNK